MGRRVNSELRRLVLHFYSVGYTPAQIAVKVAEVTGKRYSRGYIRKLLSVMRAEGLLSKPPAASAWYDLFDMLKSARLHCEAARAHLSVGEVGKAKGEVEWAIQSLERAQAVAALLLKTFDGVKVVKL